jgi:multisubunit Na+/H+ antiporter MnhG subunit
MATATVVVVVVMIIQFLIYLRAYSADQRLVETYARANEANKTNTNGKAMQLIL